MVGLIEETEIIDGEPIFWRSGPSPATPPLYLHGVPSNSDDWTEFLQLTGGFAPDLPGFGRSSKRGNRDYTVEGFDRFIEWFRDCGFLQKPGLETRAARESAAFAQPTSK